MSGCNHSLLLWRRDGKFGSKVGQIGPKWAKCTDIWSEKAPDLTHLEPIWPTLEPNLPSLSETEIASVRAIVMCRSIYILMEDVLKMYTLAIV